jgi:signal peptidase
MITKGDANNSVERWSLPLSGTIGRVAYRLPRLGYALAFTRGPISHVVLIVIPVVILGVAELYRIWRPRRREPVAEAVVASE